MALFLLLTLTQAVTDEFTAKIDALEERLDADEWQVRMEARQELMQLARNADRAHARRTLLARINELSQRNAQPELRGQLADALASVPVLELTLALNGEARRNQCVTFDVRLRNLGDEEVTVFIPTTTSCECGAAYPQCTVEFNGPEYLRMPKQDCECAPPSLGPNDFVTLKQVMDSKGSVCDLFGSGTLGSSYPWTWMPGETGTYTVTVTLDYTINSTWQWWEYVAEGRDLERVGKCLASVPLVKVEAKLKVEVKE
jgi:hypothetical protein